jgi:hypothetical protein
VSDSSIRMHTYIIYKYCHVQTMNVCNPVFIVIFSTLLVFTALVPIEQKANAIRPYDSGYNHGCNDGNSGAHIYLDASGGPGAHTGAFMQGYNAGYNACSNTGGDGTPSTRQDSHYQIGYNDGCAGRFVPGHHTSEYESGYAAGQAACSHNGGGISPAPAPLQPNPVQPQSPASPPIPNTGNVVVDKIVSLFNQHQTLCGTPICSSLAPSAGVDIKSCMNALPAVREFFNSHR